MLPSRSLLAAFLLLLAAPFLLAPAHARAADTVEMQFKVEVTGIHVVDWSYRPSTAGETCKAWSKGEGTQTTGFSTKRPVKYVGMKIVGKLPKAMAKAPRFTLLGFGRPGDFKATVERKGDWEDHTVPMTAECTPCGPRSEYGACDDAPHVDPARLLNCGRRDIKAASAHLTFIGKHDERDEDLLAPLTDALRVEPSAGVDGLFGNCPPELADGTGRDLKHPDPMEVSFVGAQARKITKMRVGQRIRLHDSVEAGFVSAEGAEDRETTSCSAKTLQGFGYRECAVTDATVEVRRVR